ncbi:calcium-binding protein [Sphingomonas sp. ID0503]|uniref:calcium-binding protein n=1 Tax=Sphingomonas sp. ID0503 TaxID=3399691 RepID=UPI003AFA311F
MLYRLTSKNDKVHGTKSADIVYGKVSSGGTLLFSGGIDSISTGAGADRIRVYTHQAKVAAGSGNDDITLWVRQGSTKDNVVHGNSGNDRIQVRVFDAASVLAKGESGNDTFVYVENSKQKGSVILDGGTGNDSLLLPDDGARTTNVAGLTLRSVETLVLNGDVRIAGKLLDGFSHVGAVSTAKVHTITIQGTDAVAVAIDQATKIATTARPTIDLTGSKGDLTINIGKWDGPGDGAVVTGGLGGDLISAAGIWGDDTLSGGAGDDTIDGGFGNGNDLYGGTGDDVFKGGGADIFSEEDDDDVIQYSYNSFDGGDGIDTVIYDAEATVDLEDRDRNGGAAFEDFLKSIENVTATIAYGDAAANLLTGREVYGRGGDDVLNDEFSAGNHVMDGGVGDDLIVAGGPESGGSYSLIGGDGADTIEVSGTGVFVIAGDAGDDTITVSSTQDTSNEDTTIDGGSGDDRIILAGDAEFSGVPGIDGGEGIDIVDFSAAYYGYRPRLTYDLQNDTPANSPLSNVEGLVGREWKDMFAGNAASNQFDGRAGNDTLIGRDGTDTLLGGSGNDLLDGGAGKDSIDGGTGTDTLTYAGASGAVRADLQNGYYNNKGDAAGDKIRNVENLIGSDFGDSLRGNNVANRIDGGEGADFLHGRGGNDTLVAGDGIDELTGGSGKDLFVLIGSSFEETDTVIDFENGIDKVDLTGVSGAFEDIVTDQDDVDGDGQIDDLTVTYGQWTFNLLNASAEKIDRADFII